jgi:GNAT superfamily N-acetyltransferase
MPVQLPFVPDNHDSRIRYYELLLQRERLDGLPDYTLPEGYRFAMYRPGDRDSWIAIEHSARELHNAEQGLEVWARYFGWNENELPERMVFIENEAGEKVATATAYFDIYGRDRSGAGWLHWVAVRREDQGRGLARPLIAYTLRLLRSLGSTRAKIPTQTTTWVACRLYLDFGFTPVPENAVNSREGWRIMRALTDHPALQGFEPAATAEILSGEEEQV